MSAGRKPQQPEPELFACFVSVLQGCSPEDQRTIREVLEQPEGRDTRRMALLWTPREPADVSIKKAEASFASAVLLQPLPERLHPAVKNAFQEWLHARFEMEKHRQAFEAVFRLEHGYELTLDPKPITQSMPQAQSQPKTTGSLNSASYSATQVHRAESEPRVQRQTFVSPVSEPLSPTMSSVPRSQEATCPVPQEPFRHQSYPQELYHRERGKEAQERQAAYASASPHQQGMSVNPFGTGPLPTGQAPDSQGMKASRSSASQARHAASRPSRPSRPASEHRSSSSCPFGLDPLPQDGSADREDEKAVHEATPSTPVQGHGQARAARAEPVSHGLFSLVCSVSPGKPGLTLSGAHQGRPLNVQVNMQGVDKSPPTDRDPVSLLSSSSPVFRAATAQESADIRRLAARHRAGSGVPALKPRGGDPQGNWYYFSEQEFGFFPCYAEMQDPLSFAYNMGWSPVDISPGNGRFHYRYTFEFQKAERGLFYGYQARKDNPDLNCQIVFGKPERQRNGHYTLGGPEGCRVLRVEPLPSA